MQGLIQVYLDNVCFQFWESKKGYYYRQSELDVKPKRISSADYLSAFEQYHNL